MLVVGFAFWLVPPVALALTGGRGGSAAAAAAGTGLSALFWMLIALGMRIPPWYGLLYPLGALIAARDRRPVNLARRPQGGMERPPLPPASVRYLRTSSSVSRRPTRDRRDHLEPELHVADGQRERVLATGVGVPLTV